MNNFKDELGKMTPEQKMRIFGPKRNSLTVEELSRLQSDKTHRLLITTGIKTTIYPKVLLSWVFFTLSVILLTLLYPEQTSETIPVIILVAIIMVINAIMITKGKIYQNHRFEIHTWVPVQDDLGIPTNQKQNEEKQ